MTPYRETLSTPKIEYNPKPLKYEKNSEFILFIPQLIYFILTNFEQNLISVSKKNAPE